MKRFHVHLHVDDLTQSIAFYNQLFAAQPARLETDYAKWMLEDPPVNFAISTRGHAAGIDHLGHPDRRRRRNSPRCKARAERADMALEVEGETTCCYARSEKHWVTDPQGIAWEHFHTLADIPVFNEAATPDATAAACCAPRRAASRGHRGQGRERLLLSLPCVSTPPAGSPHSDARILPDERQGLQRSVHLHRQLGALDPGRRR